MICEPIRNLRDKVSRNAPCPCGSGKKHKACHLRAIQLPKFKLPVELAALSRGDRRWLGGKRESDGKRVAREVRVLAVGVEGGQPLVTVYVETGPDAGPVAGLTIQVPPSMLFKSQVDALKEPTQ